MLANTRTHWHQAVLLHLFKNKYLPLLLLAIFFSLCSQGDQGNHILTSVWTVIGLNNWGHSSVELIASKSNGNTLQNVVFSLLLIVIVVVVKVVVIVYLLF